MKKRCFRLTLNNYRPRNLASHPKKKKRNKGDSVARSILGEADWRFGEEAKLFVEASFPNAVFVRAVESYISLGQGFRNQCLGTPNCLAQGVTLSLP